MRPFASLRVRLALLVLLAIAPALGFVFYSNLEQRRLAVAHARGDALTLARLAANNERRVAEGAHQLLIALRQFPETRGGDSAACAALLARLLPQYPAYANFGVADSNGDVFCSALPLPVPVNVAESYYFRAALERMDLVAGEYQIGRIVGRPAIQFALPQLGDDGHPTGVVFVELDLAWLNRTLADAGLPEGAALAVTDRSGTILARSPESEGWIGKPLPEASVVEAIRSGRAEGSAETVGPDGAPLLYGYSSMDGAASLGIHVAVGVPRDVLLGPIDSLFLRALAGLAVGGVLALVASWFIGDLFIMRRLDPLIRATRRLAAGDLSARSGVAGDGGEVGGMAQAFDEMAASLEEQTAGRRHTESHLRLKEDALQRRAEELAAIQATVIDVLSPQDLTRQLHLIVERAVRLLSASSGELYLCDPECREALRVVGHDASGDGAGAAPTRGEDLAAAVARAGEPLIVDDHETWAGRAREDDDGPPFQASIGVPMTWQGQVLGVIQVLSRAPDRRFAAEDLGLLTLFANHATVAVQSARLVEAEREQRQRAEARAVDLQARERYLTLLNEITRVALEHPDFHTMLHVVAGRLGDLFEADGCLITLWDEATQSPVPVTAYKIPEDGYAPFRVEPGEPTLTAAVMAAGQPVAVSDVLDSALVSPRLASPLSARSLLGLPLIVDGDRLGAALVAFRRPRDFTAEEIARGAQAAQQIALALANARLVKTEREHRELAETLRQVASALNTSLDRERVLELILEQLSRVVEYDSASVMLLSGDGVRVVARRSRRSEETQRVHASLPVEGLAHVRQVLDERRPVVIQDTTGDPRWRRLPGTEYIGSWLGVPLIAHDTVIGLLNVNMEQPGRYSPRDADVALAFAHHAATAIANARLLAETKRRADEFAALYETIGDLGSHRELPHLLKTIIDRATSLLNSPGGSIYLYDATHDDLELVVERGFRLEGRPIRLALGEGGAGHVARTRQPLLVEDYHTWEGRSPKFAGTHLSAGLQVPMLFGGELLGVLGVHQTADAPRPFKETDIGLLALFAGQAASAVHNARLFSEAGRRLQHLQALHAVDMAISANLDLRVTLNVLLDQVINQLRIHAADVLLLHPRTQAMEVVAGRGFRSSTPQHVHLRLGEGHAGLAALERRIVRVTDLPESPGDVGRTPAFKREGFLDYCAVPLIAKGQVKGVLEIFQREALRPDTEWMDFLEALALQTAIAIDNTELFDNLQRSNADLVLAYDATIEGWSRALDLRDESTEGHTQRVTDLCIRLARRLGAFSESELVHVRRGALLHDIGKMGIPDSILLKPGPLTGDEWAIMRRHPVYAYEMLSPINYLRPALDIPYCHHERWDGTGYPRGLQGEQIPLAARIFAVIDVWDALLSDRPYRKAWTPEAVREHIGSLSGSHFDPRVVDIFLGTQAHDASY